MQKLSILFFLLLFAFKSQSQLQTVDQGQSGTMTSIRFYNMPDNTYHVLEGSPYLNVEFQNGSVLPAGSIPKWLDGYKLRLNTYTNQLEFKQDNSIKTILPTEVKAFKIGEATYLSGYPPVDKLTRNSYYQILYDGKTKLLKNTTTVLQEVKSADDVKQGDKFTTYTYYYLLENDIMTKFFPTKKNFLKAFPSAKLAKVETYTNDKKLKFKDDNDFVEVVKYYDTLE